MKLQHCFFIIIFPFLSVNTFSQSAELSLIDSLHNQFNHEKALELLAKLYNADSTDIETTWRISREKIDLARSMPDETDEDVLLEFYNKALLYADKTIDIDSSQSIGYLRRAIANGKIALFKGVFSVAGTVDEVKADCEKAIELSNGSNYTQALSHYVLARTHAKISEKWAPARAVLGLGWADNEIAISEYKKTLELFPAMIMFHLDYAKSLIEEDLLDEAIVQLEKCKTIPIINEEDGERLKEVDELLKELKE